MFIKLAKTESVGNVKISNERLEKKKSLCVIHSQELAFARWTITNMHGPLWQIQINLVAQVF